MKSGTVIGVVVLVAAALIYLGVGRNSAPEGPGGPGGRAGGPPPMPVSVATIQTREFADVVEALGELEAVQSATLSAPQTEQIQKVNFDSGQTVAKGQVLFVLDGGEERADLSAARAVLNEAELQLKRTQTLVDKGIYAAARLEKDRAARDAAAANLSARAARGQDRVIRAPFSGVVGLRTVNPGDLARAGDMLVSIDDTSRLRLDVMVPEQALRGITTGAFVDVTSVAYPDQIFDGKIAHISPRAQAGTGLIAVRVELNNTDGGLRPGQSALAQMKTGTRQSLSVPEDAIFYEGADTYVYVLNATEDGGHRLERRAVELGIRQNNFAEVLTGPATGTQVVSGGLNRVRPGQPVVPQNTDKPAADNTDQKDGSTQ